MPTTAAGILWIEERDIYTDFSFVVTGLSDFPGILSAAPRDIPLIEGPEINGAIVDPAVVRRRSAKPSVTGRFEGANVAAAILALDNLKGLLGAGEVRLRTTYASDRYCLGICDPLSAVSDRILNGVLTATLSFVVKDGTARRIVPDGIALTTTRIACPIGNSTSSPVILVHGGGAALVNPVVTVRNAAGDIVQTMGFTVSLGVSDALRIDCARAAVDLVSAGALSDALAAGYWTSGDFPLLRPADGWGEIAAYPTVEVSASSGTAQGCITYTRRFL